MNKQNKVLLVAYNDLGLGGIQNVIMNIVRGLSSELIIDIVCFDADRTDFDDEFRSYGGSIFRVETHQNRNRLAKKLDFYFRGRRMKGAIRQIILHHGPYIAVHSHKETENGWVLKAAKDCGVPVRIAHAHTAFERKYNPVAKAYVSFLKKLITQNATDLVACSKKAGSALFGTQACHVIYNTVDRRFFESEWKPSPHDAPVLLQVGMICENKNQMFSVSVLCALTARCPGAKLVLIGAPKDAQMERYLAELKMYVKEAGMDDAVSFLPADSDVKAEMEKADYCLLPSRFEGLGITVLEAQALGMTCFVSSSVPSEADCGGCVFLDLEAGAEAWADRIARQIETDHGARKEHDMSRFQQDVIMEQYRNLYNGKLS